MVSVFKPLLLFGGDGTADVSAGLNAADDAVMDADMLPFDVVLDGLELEVDTSDVDDVCKVV